MIWKLRLRQSGKGVIEVNVEASSAQKADEVARAYVNQEPGRVFIAVTPFIVADESILPKPEPVGAAKNR